MTAFCLAHEQAVRAAAFRYLEELTVTEGESLPWQALAHGFNYEGEPVPLVSQNGIFKPKILDCPISIRTTPPKPGKEAPYADRIGANGTLRYSFRDPSKPAGRADNRRLIRAAELGLPMIYFFGIVKGVYLASWPAFIEEVDEHALEFAVRLDSSEILPELSSALHGANILRDPAPEAIGRRRYVTSLVARRLHQSAFRSRVLRAYREHCAVCRLRHVELLDAAHIIEDSKGGEPVVQNGLSLCKLHHAAFDANVLGITPDYVIHIREDILDEIDGPMLEHGIKGRHGQTLVLPRSATQHPRKTWLEERFGQFKAAR